MCILSLSPTTNISYRFQQTIADNSAVKEKLNKCEELLKKKEIECNALNNDFLLMKRETQLVLESYRTQIDDMSKKAQNLLEEVAFVSFFCLQSSLLFADDC
jgi:hypothetical protein